MERPDRRDYTLDQANRLELAVSFVEAIGASDVSVELSELVGLSPGRIACWLSHQKAWRQARDLGVEFALIMEDDVRWLRSPMNLLRSLSKGNFSGFDILQLGSLGRVQRGYSRKAELARRISVGARAASRVLPIGKGAETWLVNRSQSLLQARIEIEAEGLLEEEVVWGTFGIGAHAYVIRTDVVERLLRYNKPPFLATDDALSVLSAQRSFLVGSLSVPMATQAPLSSNLR